MTLELLPFVVAKPRLAHFQELRGWLPLAELEAFLKGQGQVSQVCLPFATDLVLGSPLCPRLQQFYVWPPRKQLRDSRHFLCGNGSKASAPNIQQKADTATAGITVRDEQDQSLGSRSRLKT